MQDEEKAYRDEGIAIEQHILQELDLDNERQSPFSNRRISWSRQYSCRVLIKKYSKRENNEITKAQLEIAALLACKEDATPPLLDYFDPSETIWVVMEERDDVPLKRYIEGYGTLSEEMIKSAVTQLFSGLAAMFMAGFAHLRICDETLYMNAEGQLTIKDFFYAHKYGAQKLEDLYATTDVRYGRDIYAAPEVLSTVGNYNARKAVLWSCGVAIYYMATGQTERLSNLDRPTFATTSAAQIQSTPTNTVLETQADERNVPGTPPTPSRRRSSLATALAHRRRSSANNVHSRKASLTQPPTIITYPGTRFETASWVRDIISKMLIVNPLRRAELIEVASKVPREVVAKTARPLLELCWLDYKEHVGPYAGLNFDIDDSASISSSLFSGVSRMSNPFAGLLSGRRKSSIDAGGSDTARAGRTYAGFV
ncbi:hypothetical protein LTR64_004485 [Lithohypha guttulata]|uniref:uncharacterized protein n=1 Tax=Lithohypha guttulata TaxID=1690604 RepID=UPI002DDF3B4B|nr:hypothetical protein LTR51_006219 [Lithohypha guttulata]